MLRARIVRIIVLFLCFTFASGLNFFSDEAHQSLLRIAEPTELGNYLIERLAQNDARFLLSKQCFLHLLEYAKGLLGIKLWAFKMFDSSAKLPSGLLRGNGGALGAFDQCIGIKAENTSVGTIRGKYCLGGLRILNLTSFKLSDFMPAGSPQSRLINLNDTYVSLPWGVCLPDACSAKDFRFLHLYILYFADESCQTEESQHRDLDDGDIGAIAFLGVVAGLIVLSTTYDVIFYYFGKGPGSTLLRCFSLLTNISKIVTVKEEEDDLSCLHGMRALSMLFLIFGFRFIMYALSPLVNWLDLFMWLIDKNKSVVIEAVIAADTFFVISGMLISYNYLKSTERGGMFNIFVYYLNRIIRLTPALVAAVLVHATLMRHIGSGPIWPTIRDKLLVESCREHWWSSLLYVQNYVNPGILTICIMQTWQLSADMQLFLLSPLILVPLRKAPKFTLAAVGGLLLCAIVSPFLAAWVYEIKAVIVTNRSLQDLKNFVEHFYYPVHTRAAPWFIGFILGYLIYEIKTKKPKINISKGPLKATVLLLWAAAGGLMALCIFIGRELIGKEYNWLTHALYLSFMRPTWALAVSWMILACVSGHGGPVNKLLSAPIFYVISRISYSTYLINVSLMAFLTYQTRVGIEFDEFDAVCKYWADIVFSLALGFVWTLAFESPMITIGKVIFGRSKEMQDLKTAK